MHDMLADPIGAEPAAKVDSDRLLQLSRARPGQAGVIVEVRADAADPHGVTAGELERRLLEFGFVEGARLEVLHEGAIRRDPIAVKVDDMRIALRRRDAAEVWVLLDAPGA
jgi:ferrous iron transport protein A